MKKAANGSLPEFKITAPNTTISLDGAAHGSSSFVFKSHVISTKSVASKVSYIEL